MGKKNDNITARPRRVTIRDVAEVAGVSVSTVSHVLNNYGDISPETEQHVRKTMEALNYYPSSLARRLTRNRSHLFQLLLFSVEGLQHPFFYEVTCGIAEEAEKADYELLLSVQRAGDGEGRWRDSLRRCVESRVEGLIVMGTLPHPEVLTKIETNQIPVAFIDIPYQGSAGTYVSSDNVVGARLAVEHLLSLGHKKIAFIDGSPRDSESKWLGPDGGVGETRFYGYTLALEAQNIPVDPSLIGYGEFTQAGAEVAVLRILEEHPDLTAIFAVSDLMAIGAMRAIRSVGKKVPNDIAVVGYDDIEAASFVRPSLSTIRQDGLEMGKRAVREILRFIDDPGAVPSRVILPVELIVRESCGATRSSKWVSEREEDEEKTEAG